MRVVLCVVRIVLPFWRISNLDAEKRLVLWTSYCFIGVPVAIVNELVVGERRVVRCRI